MTTLHWPEAQRWNDAPPDRQAQAPSSAHAEPGGLGVDVVPLPAIVGAEAAADDTDEEETDGPVVEVAAAADGLAEVTNVVAGCAGGVGEEARLFVVPKRVSIIMSCEQNPLHLNIRT